MSMIEAHMVYKVEDLVLEGSVLRCFWYPGRKHIVLESFLNDESWPIVLGEFRVRHDLWYFCNKCRTPEESMFLPEVTTGIPDERQLINKFVRSLDQETYDHKEEFQNPFWSELLRILKKSVPVYEIMYR